MKNLALIIGGALAVAGIVGAAEPTTSPTTAPTTQSAAPTTQSAKPVNKYCAVEGEGNPVDPKVTVVYQGKVIGFCCEDCIKEFNKDPEKYMKTLK